MCDENQIQCTICISRYHCKNTQKDTLNVFGDRGIKQMLRVAVANSPAQQWPFCVWIRTKCRDNSYQLVSLNDRSRNFPLVKDDCISYLSPWLMRFKCKLSRSQDMHRTVVDKLYPLIPNIWLNKFFKINKNPKQNFQGQFEREADTPLSSFIRQKNRLFKCFQKICLPTLNSPSVSPSVSSKDALSSHF